MAGRTERIRRVLSTGRCALLSNQGQEWGNLYGATKAAPWGEVGPAGRATFAPRTRQLTSQASEGIAVHQDWLPGENPGNSHLRPHPARYHDPRHDPSAYGYAGFSGQRRADYGEPGGIQRAAARPVAPESRALRERRSGFSSQ